MYDIAAILEIISSISSSLALDKILAEFTEKTAHIIGADGCTISNWDRETETITRLASYISPQLLELPPDNRTIAVSLARHPLSGRVLQQQLPFIVYIGDPLADEAILALFNAFGWTGVLMIPMLYKGEAVGLLELFTRSKKHRPFSAEDIPLCQALANQAAVAIENARLYQEAEEGQLHAEAMYVIGQALASELDYNRNVQNVADFAYRLVNADFVYVVTPAGKKGFRLMAVAGPNKPDPSETGGDASRTLLAHSRSLLTQVIRSEAPLLIADIQQAPDLPSAWPKEAQGSGWRTFLAVPMLAHNRLLGVLAAYGRQPDAFNYQDIGILMSLASQAAVAIQNAQLFAERETQREALQQLSLRLVNAQEEERRRISREIHDELGQALTAIKINLDIARRSLPGDSSGPLPDSLQEANLLVVQTLERARNLSLELHPAILDDLGLVAALRWELHRYEQRTGQTIHFDEADLANTTLRPELKITAYRIIMEALTNVARHAQAGQVWLELRRQDGGLVIKVEDDGLGFEPKRLFTAQTGRRSLGLVSMRERTELLGGQFEIQSKPGHGTKIQVWLPI
jgi:signal transduction histidine kinase